MSDYLDNQEKWSWNITDSEAKIITDHGDHTHTLNVTNVPIGEMVDHTGKVLGDAHRAAPHDIKENVNVTTNVREISLIL